MKNTHIIAPIRYDILYFEAFTNNSLNIVNVITEIQYINRDMNADEHWHERIFGHGPIGVDRTEHRYDKNIIIYRAMCIKLCD
jgi:hypothetical protein